MAPILKDAVGATNKFSKKMQILLMRGQAQISSFGIAKKEAEYSNLMGSMLSILES